MLTQSIRVVFAWFRFTVLVGMLILHALPASGSVISFEPASVVGPGILTDPGYRDVLAIAKGANDVWLIAWVTPSNVGGTIGVDRDLLFVRSTDDGATWSTPQPLNVDANDDSFDDRPAVVTTDGTGVWLAVWERWHSSESGTDIYFARSTDNGATWSTPQPLHDDAGTNTIGDVEPVVATDGFGRWIVIWSERLAGVGPRDIYASRSDDAGMTWTSRTTIGTTSLGGILGPRLVGTATGTWILAFKENDDSWQRFRRSTDGGLTWGSGNQEIFCGISANASLATDTMGTWILACTQDDDDNDVVMLRSSDDGVSWDPERTLDPNANVPNHRNGSSSQPQVVYGAADDRWVAFWTSSSRPFGLDVDVLMSVSSDGGDTWRQPVAVNGGAAKDNDGAERSVRAATDGGGKWLAAYIRRRPAHLPFVPVVARSIPDCPSAPRLDCTGLGTTGKSKLKARRNPGRKNTLIWKWYRGKAFDAAEIGDPTTTSNYLLCLYDEVAAVAEHIFEKDLPTGATCTNTPCWQVEGNKARYLDRRQTDTAVKDLKIEGGPDGGTRILLKAGGPSLGLPPFPLQFDSAVTYQLLNEETGACWSARFDSFKKNAPNEITAIIAPKRNE